MLWSTPQPNRPPSATDIVDLIDAAAACCRRSEVEELKKRAATALDRYVDERIRLAIEGIRSRRSK